jgi:hypothetical protein
MPRLDRRIVGPFPCEVDFDFHYSFGLSNAFSTNSQMLCSDNQQNPERWGATPGLKGETGRIVTVTVTFGHDHHS